MRLRTSISVHVRPLVGLSITQTLNDPLGAPIGLICLVSSGIPPFMTMKMIMIRKQNSREDSFSLPHDRSHGQALGRRDTRINQDMNTSMSEQFSEYPNRFLPRETDVAAY